MRINELERIAIVGVGLLGGSIGLALRAVGFSGSRVGIGRRTSSLERAVACEAVDETTCEVAAGVRDTDLVILCTHLSSYESMFRQMAGSLRPGTRVTDVGSAKAEAVRLAGRCLPKSVRFVGSHPMAGSERTGVEFARADLFDRSLCLVTPGPKTNPADVQWVSGFWETLGAYTTVMSPRRHDALLARVSHLPHALACALVQLALRDSAIDVAGPGFADVTRIASGDPAMWTDIFRANRKAMVQAIDRLLREMTVLRQRLAGDDSQAILDWLSKGKSIRDQWIADRYKKKVLPP